MTPESLVRSRVIEAPVVAIQEGSSFIILIPGDHYHVAADHHDPVQLGMELVLIVVAVIVAGRLVVASRVGRLG